MQYQSRRRYPWLAAALKFLPGPLVSLGPGAINAWSPEVETCGDFTSNLLYMAWVGFSEYSGTGATGGIPEAVSKFDDTV